MIPVPGVYMIRNRVSGQTYVGSSRNVARRWQLHVGALRRGSHDNAALQADWAAYGPEGFLATLLEPVRPDGARLNNAERRWGTWVAQSGSPLYSRPRGRADMLGSSRLPGLYRRRVLAALSQAELAERAGIRPLTISRLEHGGETRLTTVRKLAEALACEPRVLMEAES